MKQLGKKADFSFGMVAMIIVIILAAVIIIFIMGKFNVGPDFFYAACEGDMEGPKLYDEETNISIGIINSRCTMYDNTGKTICETAYPKIKLRDYGDVPFCIWLEGRTVRIGQEAADLGLEFFSWPIPSGLSATKCEAGQSCLDIGADGYVDKCVVNGLATCAVLSQNREPKCDAVPRCTPVNVVESLVRGLRR